MFWLLPLYQNTFHVLSSPGLGVALVLLQTLSGGLPTLTYIVGLGFKWTLVNRVRVKLDPGEQG